MVRRTFWGEAGTFRTNNVPAIVTPGAASDITDTSATLGGEVTFDGGDSPEVRLCWGNEDAGMHIETWDKCRRPRRAGRRRLYLGRQ